MTLATMPHSDVRVSSVTPAAAHDSKSATAYRTISEAADLLGVPQHVLRFWETKFPAIRPMKRSGGRRYYRPQDLATLATIRHLLYGQGYTIKGAQRLLKAKRGTHELGDMDRAALLAAAAAVTGLEHGIVPELDQLVEGIAEASAALSAETEDLFDDIPATIAVEIPGHLPAKPAALMATGLAAGWATPEAAPISEPDAVIAGLPIQQRQRLEGLLAELLSLKAELL